VLGRLHRLLWQIKIGRCGPTARALALSLRRLVPIRGIGPLSSMLLGVPPAGGRPCRAIAQIDGASFELDLQESLHRVVFLDLFGIELRRTLLPLLRAGDLFVDVGANFGFWTVLAARRGCRVVAAEPVAGTRRLLGANIERNGVGDRVEVVAQALSDAPGAVVVAVPDGESGQASVHPDPGARLERHEVPATTLDALVGQRRVRFLKVDVEGHELAVLRGAVALLASGRVDFLLVELSGALLDRAGLSSREIVDLLIADGYELVRFVPANAGLFPRRSYARVSLAELRAGGRAGDALWRRATLE
jgi:FkbM family methyltransferase